MPTASLDLPFAVPAKEGGKTLTPSMEVAAILLQAEMKRRKQGLFAVAAGEISFVSKLHYPLWAVPWENRSLIVDGLGVSPSVIARQQSPDVTLFIEDIERGASVRELFRSALEKHLNLFKGFSGRVHVQMGGLLADSDLLVALAEHIKDASSEKKDGETAIVLAPLKLNVQAATETAKLAQDLHKQTMSEISGLEYARNLLDETTNLHEQMISKEISNTRNLYDGQIAQLKPMVEDKVDQLIDKRDAQIDRMNHSKEKGLKGKENEKTRREWELQKLELSKADLVRKREIRRQKRDKVGEAHWNDRIRTIENRTDEARTRIHTLARFIEKTRAQTETDIEKMKQGYQWLIDQEMRKVTDVEAKRNEAVGAKQREIEALKFVAKKIEDEIGGLSARKSEEADELQRLSVTQRLNEVTLLCLPFYLAGYQTENAKRFHIFPPVKVQSPEGVVATIRKKLRVFRALPRASLFLQPRSKAVTQLLDSVVEEKMKSDKVFSENLIEAALSGNILSKDNFKQALTKGVAELRAEDWMTLKEEDLLKTYI